MSDRISVLTVLMEESVSAEYAEQVIQAITLIHGVISVRPESTTAFEEQLARERVRNELLGEIRELVLKRTERRE